MTNILPLRPTPICAVYAQCPHNKKWEKVECWLADVGAQNYFLDFWRRHSLSYYIEWYDIQGLS